MTPSPVVFGVFGWRGILSDDFTFHNARRAIRAVARLVREEKRGRVPRLFIGYDTRFLSAHLAREAAAVLQSEGVKPRLAPDFVPAPVVAHAIRRGRLDGGLHFTGGRSSSEVHGIRFSTRGGVPAPAQVTEKINLLLREIADGSPAPPSSRPLELRPVDLSGSYRATVLRSLDRRAIARARLRIVCDPAHGAGRGYLAALLSPAARTTPLRSGRDVRFGGLEPDCAERHLAGLCTEVRRSKAHLGLATDSDAERFGIVDRGGLFVSANLALALLADYLLETRGCPPGIARTAATTRLLDDVAESHGVPCSEAPADFDPAKNPLLRGKILMTGEESAGLAIPGPLPGWDGILAACLAAEMVARRGTSLRQQVRQLFRKVGPRYSGRLDLPVSAAEAPALERRLESPPSSLAGAKVREARRAEGTLLVLDDGSWIHLHSTALGRTIRCLAEARSRKNLARLLEAGRALTLDD
jgi:phosphoglucomutase